MATCDILSILAVGKKPHQHISHSFPKHAFRKTRVSSHAFKRYGFKNGSAALWLVKRFRILLFTCVTINTRRMKITGNAQESVSSLQVSRTGKRPVGASKTLRKPALTQMLLRLRSCYQNYWKCRGNALLKSFFVSLARSYVRSTCILPKVLTEKAATNAVHMYMYVRETHLESTESRPIYNLSCLNFWKRFSTTWYGY